MTMETSQEEEKLRLNVDFMMLEYAVLEVWKEFQMKGMISKYKTIYLIQSCLFRTEDVQSSLHQKYRLFITLISQLSNGANLDLLCNKQSEREDVTFLENALETLSLISESFPELATHFEQVRAVMMAQAVFVCCRAGDWNTAWLVYAKLQINDFESEYPHSLLHRRLAWEVRSTLNSSDLQHPIFPGHSYPVFVKLDVMPLLKEIYQTFPEPIIIQHARRSLIDQPQLSVSNEEVHHCVKEKPSDSVTVPVMVLEKRPDISTDSICTDHEGELNNKEYKVAETESKAYKKSKSNKSIEPFEKKTTFQTSCSSPNIIVIDKLLDIPTDPVSIDVDPKDANSLSDKQCKVAEMESKAIKNLERNKIVEQSGNNAGSQTCFFSRKVLVPVLEKLPYNSTGCINIREEREVELRDRRSYGSETESENNVIRDPSVEKTGYQTRFSYRKEREISPKIVDGNKTDSINSSSEQDELDSGLKFRKRRRKKKHKFHAKITLKPRSSVRIQAAAVKKRAILGSNYYSGKINKFGPWTKNEELQVVEAVVCKGMLGDWAGIRKEYNMHRSNKNIYKKWIRISKKNPKVFNMLKKEVLQKNRYKREASTDHINKSSTMETRKLESDHTKNRHLHTIKNSATQVMEGGKVDKYQSLSGLSERRRSASDNEAHDSSSHKIERIGIRRKRAIWTEEEEIKLIRVVMKAGSSNWRNILKISKLNRSIQDIMNKWHYLQTFPKRLERLKRLAKKHVYQKPNVVSEEEHQMSTHGNYVADIDAENYYKELQLRLESGDPKKEIVLGNDTINSKMEPNIERASPRQINLRYWTREEELKLVEAVVHKNMLGQWTQINSICQFENSSSSCIATKWKQISSTPHLLESLKGELKQKTSNTTKLPNMKAANADNVGNKYSKSKRPLYDNRGNIFCDDKIQTNIVPQLWTLEEELGLVNTIIHRGMKGKWKRLSEEFGFKRSAKYYYKKWDKISKNKKRLQKAMKLLEKQKCETNVLVTCNSEEMTSSQSDYLEEFDENVSNDAHDEYEEYIEPDSPAHEFVNNYSSDHDYLLADVCHVQEAPKKRSNHQDGLVETSNNANYQHPDVCSSSQNVNEDPEAHLIHESTRNLSQNSIQTRHNSYQTRLLPNKKPYRCWTEEEELKLTKAVQCDHLSRKWTEIKYIYNIDRTPSEISQKWKYISQHEMKLRYLEEKLTEMVRAENRNEWSRCSDENHGNEICQFPSLAESSDTLNHLLDKNGTLSKFSSRTHEFPSTERNRTKVFVACGSFRLSRPYHSWNEGEELKLVEAMDNPDLTKQWSKIRIHYQLKKTDEDISLKWNSLSNSPFRLAYLKKRVASSAYRLITEENSNMLNQKSAEYDFALDLDTWEDSIQDIELIVFTNNGENDVGLTHHPSTVESRMDRSGGLEILHDSNNVEMTDVIVDEAHLHNAGLSVSSSVLRQDQQIEEVILSDEDDITESPVVGYEDSDSNNVQEPHRLRTRHDSASYDIFSRKLSSKKLLKKLGIATPF